MPDLLISGVALMVPALASTGKLVATLEDVRHRAVLPTGRADPLADQPPVAVRPQV